MMSMCVCMETDMVRVHTYACVYRHTSIDTYTEVVLHDLFDFCFCIHAYTHTHTHIGRQRNMVPLVSLMFYVLTCIYIHTFIHTYIHTQAAQYGLSGFVDVLPCGVAKAIIPYGLNSSRIEDTCDDSVSV